jgi:hypothetical protein
LLAVVLEKLGLMEKLPLLLLVDWEAVVRLVLTVDPVAEKVTVERMEAL